MECRLGDRNAKRRLGGVVLGRTNYREADLIVTILTRELGLVSALARYGRRSIRRFGGGLLWPGAVAWYDFTIKPGGTLAFVENAEENSKVPCLPPQPVIQSLAGFALELVRGFEAPGNPALSSFNLLVRYLGRLAQVDGEWLARLINLDFVLKYMELAGFGPWLSGCHLCGSAVVVPIGWRWDAVAGGFYCPGCLGQYGRQGRSVSPALVSRLGGGLPPGESIPLTEDDLSEAEFFFEELARHQLGYPLKSMKMARQLYTRAGCGEVLT